MRLGLYQANSPAGDISAGFADLDVALSRAAGMGIEMLTLPELFLPGYVAACAEPNDKSELVDQIKGLASQHGVGLTIGLPLEEDGKLYNSAMSFGADGTHLATHHKIQLFGDQEQAAFTPGNAYTTFTYKGVTFGVLICYDVEFPEHVRALTRLGVEAILVPTANMTPFVNVHQITVPARALENGVTIVYANYCGDETPLTYTGLSGIFGPDGYSLASKGTETGLIEVDLPSGWSEHGVPLTTQLSDLRVIK